MPRAMTGWGGLLTFKKSTANGVTAVTIPVRNVSLTRQASEFNTTAHGDAVQTSGPGRVKRGGSLEAYVSADTAGFVDAIETPVLASPAQLVWKDSSQNVANGGNLTMLVIITGADQTHSSEDAAIFSITFTETIAL